MLFIYFSQFCLDSLISQVSTTRPLPPGTVVASMSSATTLSFAAASGRAIRLGLPSDSFIVAANQRPGAYIDGSWVDLWDVPKWYRLNHASRATANVVMQARCATGTAGGAATVVWITRYSVPAGFELRYTYGGRVPASWDDD